MKDLAIIPQKDRTRIEKLVFDEIPTYKGLMDVKNMEPMTGYPHYYKIRVGNYRLGFYFEKAILTFERALDRKDIYKKFP